MRFTYAITLVFAVGVSFGLEKNGYDSHKNYWKQIEITQNVLDGDSSVFCLMRHAQTDLNQKDIIQGQYSDSDIVIDEKTSRNLSLLRRPHWFAFYSGTHSRTRNTSNYIAPPVSTTYLFNVQGLGRYESMPRQEVLRMKDFWEMSKNPYADIGEVESGSSVLNRLAYGIDAVVEKDNKLIGICSSQCLINWFLKWANGDYSKTYNVENLDSVIFQYKKQNENGKEIKKLRLITETPINANCAIEILEHMGY